MKKFYLALVILIGVTAVFAQNPVAKGQTQLNVGLGLSGWGVPVYLGFDHGIHKDVTIGAEVSFRTINRKHYDDKTVIGISGNVNYHFNHILSIPQDWDFYAGLNIGYYVVSDSDPDDDYYSRLGIAAQIGGRYYFTNTVGVNLEFGGGNAFSGGKIGLSFKL